MRLPHKNLLMLVADGVEYDECEMIRNGFEHEGANVFCSAYSPYPHVETVQDGRRGPNLLIDLPYDSLPYEYFDGMIIPDGYLSSYGIADNPEIVSLVRSLHVQGAPIFASGDAAEVLYRSGIVSKQIVVREGMPIERFIAEAVSVLLGRVPLTAVT